MAKGLGPFISLHPKPNNRLFQGPKGLGPLIWDAVCTATEGKSELRSELLGSITLNGGSSALPGLAERIRYEVCLRLPPDVSPSAVVVMGGSTGDFAPWQGGVRFALANSQIRKGPVFCMVLFCVWLFSPDSSV